MRTLSRAEARGYMLGQLGLHRFTRGERKAAVRKTLAQLRCIQLDPLDPMGTNADLVVLARAWNAQRGDVYGATLPHHAFEHFAKERCLLPAAAFPFYRERAAEAPWWRLKERRRRVPDRLLEKVLAEVEARGPVTDKDLTPQGRVDPIDWSGWKSTTRSEKMALEVLWAQCRVVVCGRTSRGKLYDVPRRALPRVWNAPTSGEASPSDPHGLARWALVQRVEAAGLLARATSPCWSSLESTRGSPLLMELLSDGSLEEVRVEGSSRPYLAPGGFRRRRFRGSDDETRILAPLDPLLWDRKLVKQLFHFDYVWEVYRPAKQRKWGWYVTPILQRGTLVGRLEGSIAGRSLVVDRIWRESGTEVDVPALDACLERHAAACGADRVKRPRRLIAGRP